MCAKRQVLVIEDTPALRKLFREILTDAGYSIATAVHGADALDQLSALRPCVILLDLRMPVMDGWQFVPAYRQRPGADAHLIAVTSEYNHPSLSELGAAAIIPKPFSVDSLLETVAQWVRAHPPGTP